MEVCSQANDQQFKMVEFPRIPWWFHYYLIAIFNTLRDNAVVQSYWTSLLAVLAVMRFLGGMFWIFAPSCTIFQSCLCFIFFHDSPSLNKTMNFRAIRIENWHLYPTYNLYLKFCAKVIFYEIIDIFYLNIWILAPNEFIKSKLPFLTTI